jgi:hypothetical protein
MKILFATKAPSHQKWHQGFGVDFGVRRMTVWCPSADGWWHFLILFFLKSRLRKHDIILFLLLKCLPAK